MVPEDLTAEDWSLLKPRGLTAEALEALKDDFWKSVKHELVTRLKLKGAQANKAIKDYKSALKRHGAGDLVYHRDPEYVAEIVAGARKSGFSDPDMNTSAAG